MLENSIYLIQIYNDMHIRFKRRGRVESRVDCQARVHMDLEPESLTREPHTWLTT